MLIVLLKPIGILCSYIFKTMGQRYVLVGGVHGVALRLVRVDVDPVFPIPPPLPPPPSSSPSSRPTPRRPPSFLHTNPLPFHHLFLPLMRKCTHFDYLFFLIYSSAAWSSVRNGQPDERNKKVMANYWLTHRPCRLRRLL